MSEENIWEGLNLSEDNIKTAYDYLTPQVDNFKAATKGMLSMDIEVVPTTSGDSAKREMTLYVLFIIAPHLGGFRKKILHIAEFEDQGRFPVNLYDHINEALIPNIGEENIIKELKARLSTPKILSVVEKLYRQSIEAKKT